MSDPATSDLDFDGALIASFFRLVAAQGWRGSSVADAARAAALPLAEARARFPGRAAVLVRFGRLADQAALAETPTEGTVRDKLFDLLMRRFDALQAHRAGVIALLRALPTEPPVALLLSCATKRSMRWMLQTAGVSTAGLRGELRVRGLVAVWVWTLRAWERDESADLSGTMAALDAALRRAARFAEWLGGGTAAATDTTEPDASAAEPEAAPPEAAPDDSAPDAPLV
jgi:hypothetical protein